jgi:methyltransferase (TIGR00027 family)
MKLLLYVLLMILFTPLFLLGFPFYMLPILIRRGKVSGTAYEPFNGRLLYHLAGSRPDPAALQLAGGLPATNAGFMFLLVKPIVWVSRVSGHVPAILVYPPPHPSPMSAMVAARCEFLDQAMIDHAHGGAQVVILGAGFDTRAYGLLEDRDVTIFEVDQPGTQAVKRAAIEKAGLDASQVTFVSCDFNRQGWLDALVEHGFDLEKRTFILWEAVTMYLEAHAIESTLRSVATLPPESRIAFDFVSREWLEDTFAGKMARWAVRATYGEAFIFGFPVTPDRPEGVGNYLEEHGLALESSASFGGDGKGRAPCGGLALAVKVS